MVSQVTESRVLIQYSLLRDTWKILVVNFQEVTILVLMISQYPYREIFKVKLPEKFLYEK